MIGLAPITVSMLRRVRRRWTTRTAIARAMIGAAAGAGITLAAVTVSRLTGWFPGGFAHPDDWLSWAVPLTACCVGGGAMGAVWAAVRPPSLRKVAWMADSHHGTRDALGGAIDLMLIATIAPDQRGFAAVHLARAEAEAAKIDPIAVVPWTPLANTRSLRILPLLIIATIAAGLWLPTPTATSVALTPDDFRTVAPMSIESQVVQDVATAAATAATSLPQASAGELDSLKALEEELRQSPTADERLGERAAGLAEQVANRLDTAAQEARATDESVRRALQDRLKQAARNQSDLEAAMRAGDLAGAAAAAEELSRQARSLPPSERARVADDLKRLAEALGDGDSSPANTPAGEAARSAPSGDALAKAESTPAPADHSSEPASETAPDQAGPGPEADSIPRQAARPEPRQPAPPPSSEPQPATPPKSPIDSLRELAKKAAEEMRQPPPPPSSENTQGSQQSQPPDASGGSPASRQNQTTQSQPRQDSQRGGGDPQGEQAAPTPRPAAATETTREPQAGQPSPSGKAQPNQADPAASTRPNGTSGGTAPRPERVTERTTSPEPSQRGTQAPSTTSPATPQPQPVARPGGEEESRPAGEPVRQLPLDQDAPRQGDPSSQATPTTAPKTEAQPSGGPSPQPSPPPPASGDQPREGQPPSGQSPPSAMQRMAEQLRQMQQSGEQAERLSQQSESLRRQAREMLERMTPEQRRDAMRVARQAAEGAADPTRGPQGSGQEQPGGDGGVTRPELMPGRRAGGQPAGEGGARPLRGGQDAGRGTGPVAAPRPFPSRRDLESVPVEGIDARRMQDRDPGSRTVAEWDSPPRPGETGDAATRGPAMAEGLNEAARGAQRAIETQQVPAQYADLVRRVFRKYVERATPPSPPPEGGR